MNQPTKFQSIETGVVNAPVSLPRRQVLAGSVSALAAAGLAGVGTDATAQTSSVAPKPLPAYVGWKDPNSLIVIVQRRSKRSVRLLDRVSLPPLTNSTFAIICRRQTLPSLPIGMHGKSRLKGLTGRVRSRCANLSRSG